MTMAPELILQILMFYGFALVTIVAAFMVISFKNPVHSVLSLILAFFSSAWLFLMLGAEFIAMVLVIVYVGAVAVLFLFVVMMMDINFAQLKQGFLNYLPAAVIVALIVLVELSAVMYFSTNGSGMAMSIPKSTSVSNTHAIGMVLYTDYFLPFQISGLILLVAMIGAIVLTLRHREGVKRQKASKQFKRSRKESVEVVKVQTGKGV